MSAETEVSDKLRCFLEEHQFQLVMRDDNFVVVLDQHKIKHKYNIPDLLLSKDRECVDCEKWFPANELTENNHCASCVKWP